MAPEKVLQGTMHINNFASWKVDPRVANIVLQTCFNWCLQIKSSELKRQNWQMISALVYFYNPEKQCFKFEEITEEGRKDKFYVDFGLEDILYITGLPINGMQVSGLESEDPIGTIVEHLKLSEVEAKALLIHK